MNKKTFKQLKAVGLALMSIVRSAHARTKMEGTLMNVESGNNHFWGHEPLSQISLSIHSPASGPSYLCIDAVLLASCESHAQASPRLDENSTRNLPRASRKATGLCYLFHLSLSKDF